MSRRQLEDGDCGSCRGFGAIFDEARRAYRRCLDCGGEGRVTPAVSDYYELPCMTVGQLRLALRGLPDDMDVSVDFWEGDTVRCRPVVRAEECPRIGGEPALSIVVEHGTLPPLEDDGDGAGRRSVR